MGAGQMLGCLDHRGPGRRHREEVQHFSQLSQQEAKGSSY